MKKLKIDKKTADALRAAGICGYKDGREIFDPVPLEIPAEFQGAETMEERLQRIMQVSLARIAADQGFETPEESVDFGEDELDIEELPTQYQMAGMVIEVQKAIDEKPAQDAQQATEPSGSNPGPASGSEPEPKGEPDP
jgi:hypothetical protein